MDKLTQEDGDIAEEVGQDTLLGSTHTGNIQKVTLSAALARIHHFLGQVVDSADEQGLVQTDLPIRHYGSFPGLIQKDYQVFSHVEDTPVAVTLALHLCSPESHTLQFKRSGYDLRFLQCLRDDGLKVLNSRVLGLDVMTQRVRFEVAGDIPVRFEFAVNHLDNCIDLWVSNFASLGTVQYSIAPEKVTSAFLDEFSDYLMRRNALFLDRVVALGKRLTLKDRMIEERVDPASIGSSESNVISFYDHRKKTQKELELKFRGKHYRFSAKAGSFLIGRGNDADLRVGVLSVSREHLVITFKEGAFHLQDISSNGTFLMQDDKPEFLVHQSSKVMEGHGTIALGESMERNGKAVIRYSVS